MLKKIERETFITDILPEIKSGGRANFANYAAARN